MNRIIFSSKWYRIF